MSTSAVIVALPRPLDPIRLIGDEEKHATLLYFGETSSLPSGAKTEIIDTLQNISRMFSPFGESVMGLDRLGNDNPPALVVKLSNNSLGRIRESLLINPAIGSYLANVDQHPSFTPHVTLGYPDFQGETELRKLASDLVRVRFDRLALWWNDERIEFSLIDPLDGEMAQSVTMTEAEAHLAHFGVKGMHWGVRKSTSSSSVPKGVAKVAETHRRDPAVAAAIKRNAARATSSSSVPKGVAKVAETHRRDPAVAAAIKRNAARAKAAASSADGVAKSTLASKKVKAAVAAGRVVLSSSEVRREAAQAGKAAFTIGKYGLTPLAAATGIGIPAIAGLGISVKVLSDPAVQAAVASAAKYGAGVARDIGHVSMSAVKHVPKIDTSKIFAVKTIDRSRMSKTSGLPSKGFKPHTTGLTPQQVIANAGGDWTKYKGP